mmetsp:Transcript_39358/g.88723  ORF Transcript_39358/g.88723 Transcript_39358/m.88723 type:complete len:236 (-) Transcript_39358:386-1093(-)
MLELRQGDRPLVRRVDVLKQLLELGRVLLLGKHHGLHHHVLVRVGALDGGLAEDAGHHVQHGKVGKEDVRYEDDDIDRFEMREWSDCLDPAHASANAHEEGEHGPRERRIEHAEVRVLHHDQELRRGLRQQDREDVDDQEKQEEGPQQRPQGVHHGVHEHPQGSEELHDADDPQNTDCPHDSHHPDVVQVGYRTGVAEGGADLDDGDPDHGDVQQVHHEDFSVEEGRTVPSHPKE